MRWAKRLFFFRKNYEKVFNWNSAEKREFACILLDACSLVAVGTLLLQLFKQMRKPMEIFAEFIREAAGNLCDLSLIPPCAAARLQVGLHSHARSDKHNSAIVEAKIKFPSITKCTLRVCKNCLRKLTLSSHFLCKYVALQFRSLVKIKKNARDIKFLIQLRFAPALL